MRQRNGSPIISPGAMKACQSMLGGPLILGGGAHFALIGKELFARQSQWKAPIVEPANKSPDTNE